MRLAGTRPSPISAFAGRISLLSVLRPKFPLLVTTLLLLSPSTTRTNAAISLDAHDQKWWCSLREPYTLRSLWVYPWLAFSRRDAESTDLGVGGCRNGSASDLFGSSTLGSYVWNMSSARLRSRPTFLMRSSVSPPTPCSSLKRRAGWSGRRIKTAPAGGNMKR